MGFLFQTEYQKDAEKEMHHHNIPVDYPEFIRAKETAKNASDVKHSLLLKFYLMSFYVVHASVCMFERSCRRAQEDLKKWT